MAEEIRMKDKEVQRMPLQEDESWVICFENLSDEQNLTYWKYGCGKNFHMKWADHYASHKINNATDATCPLCRKSWGPNVLERFKKETRLFQQMQEKKKFEAKKNVYSKYNLNCQPNGVGSTDRSFIWYWWKRTILYEAKFQWIMWIDIEVWKIWYKSNYHQVHKFVVRPSPDQNWKPAFRDTELAKSKSGNNDSELTIDEFEKLLSEKQRDKFMTMQKFLTLSYEKMFPWPKEIPPNSTWATWELEIKQDVQNSYNSLKNSKSAQNDDHEYYSKALEMSCKHLMHKYWLEEVFRKKKNRWPTWDQIILPGYQSALLTKRLVNSEVWKAKNEFDIRTGNYGTIGIGASITDKSPQNHDSDEEEKEEVIDIDVDAFIDNQYSQGQSRVAASEPREESKYDHSNISRMISNYNKYQPDFGQKINPNNGPYIDPQDLYNEPSRAPFRIKNNGISSYVVFWILKFCFKVLIDCNI